MIEFYILTDFFRPFFFSLYLLCCVFDDLRYSTPLYNAVLVRPGEYFEGEEQVDEQTDVVQSFEVITNMRMVQDVNKT